MLGYILFIIEPKICKSLFKRTKNTREQNSKSGGRGELTRSALPSHRLFPSLSWTYQLPVHLLLDQLVTTATTVTTVTTLTTVAT